VVDEDQSRSERRDGQERAQLHEPIDLHRGRSRHGQHPRVQGDGVAGNFYVLSWSGADVAHETAFRRPWHRIGKSDMAHFHEPNNGEVEVSKPGTSTVLSTIGINYKGVGVACALRSFDD